MPAERASGEAKPITGYCEPLCVAPGETVRFMVSCYEPGAYHVDLVRTICGDPFATGGGYEEAEVPSRVSRDYPARSQETRPGSYAHIPSRGRLRGVQSLTLAAAVFPTRPLGAGPQALLGSYRADTGHGFALALATDGCPTLHLGAGDGAGSATLATGVPLAARRWAFVAASYDASTGQTCLVQRQLPVSAGIDAAARHARVERALRPRLGFGGDGPILLAAWLGDATRADAHYDGKLDSPRILARALDAAGLERLLEIEVPDDLAGDVVGWWDLGLGIPSEVVHDLSPNGLDGETLQLPTRGVTGARWNGEAQDWRQRPEHYAAIHFHSDDLSDAGWEPDFELRVPEGMRSGIYAARLRFGGCEDHIQFFVRPPRGGATAEVAFLAPTATYLAYANHKVHLTQGPLFDSLPKRLAPNDATLLAHPEFGPSLYCRHRDGSGVCTSSAHRPITNLRSGHLPWGFAADTRITAWLERSGHAYDVITDEDLHREGLDLLRRYRVVVTGTHPEYTSTAMFDALDAWLRHGGRLMYMGGNGFYWRIAFHPRIPGIIEVRRAEDGTRAWAAEPGESYQAFNGEYGGLWRRVRTAPNALVGVGFAAQGFDRTTGYRRTAASRDPRVAFLFEGIEGDAFGFFGPRDSPAGEEIDRYDVRLGSPSHALVVATSEGHGREMLRTKEEFLMTEPWRPDPEVRSDVVFFECPKGGAVFSTGSIGWAAALARDGYRNDVARLTTNALERFLDPKPFDLPGTPSR